MPPNCFDNKIRNTKGVQPRKINGLGREKNFLNCNGFLFVTIIHECNIAFYPSSQSSSCPSFDHTVLLSITFAVRLCCLLPHLYRLGTRDRCPNDLNCNDKNEDADLQVYHIIPRYSRLSNSPNQVF
ncbi:hypothetical protein ABW19_dt0203598 [Dactylella cylindrospora]|nr:hypothetical protein ABW19_dt0203598 [Dactylella cylindrospora]